jgi:hypothetical protein
MDVKIYFEYRVVSSLYNSNYLQFVMIVINCILCEITETAVFSIVQLNLRFEVAQLYNWLILFIPFKTLLFFPFHRL